jgi:Domain of unknown function (DUF4185)
MERWFSLPTMPGFWRRRFIALLTACWVVSGWAQGVRDVAYVAHSSQKLEQLLGDVDFQTGLPTLSLTSTRFHLDDTDLGVPFRHKGRTYLLFGDSNFPGSLDSMAWTTDTDPEAGLTLTFLNHSESFTPINIPNISHGGFDVPIFGVSTAGRIHLYYSTDSNPSVPVMGRTVLSVSTNDGVSWSAPLYTLSSNRFINVSLHRVNAAQHDGLPATNGLGHLIFGSGFYRRSDVYLAYQPESGIESKSTLRFWAGLDSVGRPMWSPRETDAAAIIQAAYTNNNGHVEGVGELSATYNVYLGKWMVLFNIAGAIHVHTADRPWGPYSPAISSFENVRDNGAGAFIYMPGLNDTNLCVPNVPGHDTTAPGGVYGPYVFPAFTAGRAEVQRMDTTVYHTMSTWKPYNSVVMRTKFHRTAPPWITVGDLATNAVSTAQLGGADAMVMSGAHADTNFGSVARLIVENPGEGSTKPARKVYLRFPIPPSAPDRILAASLELTVDAPSTATNALFYNVYGLLPGFGDWTESTITWNNAPGNDPTDAEGVDAQATVFLGTMTTTNRGPGTNAVLSSWALREFLNRPTTNGVTFIVTRLTQGAANESFASRESTNAFPPLLTLITAPKPQDILQTPATAVAPVAVQLLTAASGGSVGASSSNPALVPTPTVSAAGQPGAFIVTVTPTPGKTGRTTVTLTATATDTVQDVTTFNVLIYPRPELELVQASDGGFTLKVSGEPGPTYRIESSLDLANWRSLAVTNPPALPISVAAASGPAAQYFRVVLAP